MYTEFQLVVIRGFEEVALSSILSFILFQPNTFYQILIVVTLLSNPVTQLGMGSTDPH